MHAIAQKEFWVGGFVLYLDDNELSGGLVKECEDAWAEVQVYNSNATGRSWLPVWVQTSGALSKSKKCPVGSRPMVEKISLEQARLMGEIGKTGFLTDSTVDKAKALGLL